MALQSFPAYLQLRRQGFQVAHPSRAMRTPMASGAAKQRTLQSRRIKQYVCSYLVDSRQDYTAWEAWFFETIQETDWFRWTEPLTGATVTARVVQGTHSATPMDSALQHWEIKLTVEYYA